MYITIKVQVKSKEDEIVEFMEDETLKVRVKAAPEKGKANQAIFKLLAKHCGISASDITLVSGHTSSKKLLSIPKLNSFPWPKNI